MDVRCDRCQTEYELDDSSLDDDGVTVRCTNCGNTFLVTRAGQAPAPEWNAPGADAPPPAPEWTLQTEDGAIHRFRDLAKLHQWIIERRVTRQDQLSHAGDPFRPMGALPEFKPFFDIVDQADLARQAEKARGSRPVGKRSGPRPMPVPDDFGVDEETPVFDPPPELRTPAFDESEIPDEIPRSGPGAKKIALALVIGLMVAAGGGVALWAFNGRQPPAPAPAPAAAAPVAAPAPAPAPQAVPAPASPAPPPAATAVPPDAAAVAAPTPPAPPPAAIPAPPTPAPVPAAGVEPAPAPKLSYEKLVQEADRLLENGKTGAARKLYDQALKMKPDGVEALTGIAYAHLDQGRANEAILTFRRALGISPSHGATVFGLAEAYRSAGQKTQALETYRKYLVVSPAGRDAPAARASIRDLESSAAKEPAKAPAPTPEKTEPKPEKPEERPAPAAP